MSTTPLDDISKQAEVYAALRSALAERVTALNDGIAELRRQNVPPIKRAVSKAADAEGVLRELVERNPQCFEKPKTRIFAGVKVGYVKAKGTLEIGDASTLIERIRRHLPEQADVLIRVRETPVKEALAQLSASDLRKLGVTVVETGEQVVVRPVDSEVDKLVDALLKDVEAGE